MSLTYKLNGVALTGRVQFLPRDGNDTPALVTAAERGVLGTCGVLIEDLGASLTFNGWGVFTVEDSDASPVRVFKGLLVDRNIGRLDTFFSGTSRVYDCDLYDLNMLLQWLTPIANDGKRPAETDVVRVAWLLTNRALADIEVGGGPVPVEDKGLVSAGDAGSFLASDCRRRYPIDILRELAESSVKNFFVYDDLATDDVGLFWDLDSATVWASGISISNDPADINSTTVFAPSEDLVANRGSSEVYGAVSYGWQGDPIFVESASIQTAFGFNRQAVYDTPRVGVLATAQAQAAAWLNVRATEPDVITVRLRVPSSVINDVLAGQEIDVKLTHVPRYSGFVTGRIRRKTYLPAAVGIWDVELEIWFPPTPADDAEVGETACEEEASFAQLQGIHRNGTGPLVYDVTWLNTGDDVDANHAPAPLTGLLAYSTPVGTGATGIECLGAGDLTVTLLADVALVASGAYYGEFQVLKNGADVVLSEGYATSAGLRFESWATSPLVGVVTVEVGDILTARYVDNADYSIDTFPAGVDATDLTAEGDLCENPVEPPLPEVGDPVGPEVAGGDTDNTNTAFTTAGAYLPGTLVVIHDGTDQTAHVINEAPTAGTFELDYAPRFGATIRTRYESA